MTENEAIEELKTSIDLAKMCTQNSERKREIESYNIAIQALEEIQQYREIGTIEEFKDLKVENSELHNEVQAINANMSLFEHEIRNKAIDEFAEKMKEFIEEDMIPRARTEQVYRALTELQDYNIDEIADQMKGGE